ncbi:ABC transporter permease [Paenirhodobacter enshiensis]|uniref:ABC transporter permease n=1 Tax=Paenirhodobacter enshiensis TaxID=1105367 RepID=A0A086XSP6_9RHOB|nr:ABC transporter permease [Paenirhodobacter enshiensis]KFI25046.1 ABC transporter permease [Paenirhodobacter enshiensis]
MPSGNLVLRRVVQLVPTLFFALLLLFVMVRLLPGGPATAALGDRGTDADIARIEASYGLNRSIAEQFLSYLWQIAHGDLGVSYSLKVPVTELVLQRLPVTLTLTACGSVLALAIAVPLAALAASRRDRTTDLILRGLFQLGLSSPVFYIGILLLTLVAAKTGLFPVGGYGSGFLDNLHHLVLPSFALALNFAAVLFRNLRSAMIEAMDADYVTFAIARGLSPRVVLFGHVLRNALISTVTLFGLNVGWLIGGAVITESVFAIPGVGRLMIDSIFARDYPVIQGLLLVLVLTVSVVFLLTDIVEGLLDPRLNR